MKPRTVTSPTSRPACSTASGIIVSASMVRIAPAANAWVPATTSGDALPSAPYPTAAATVDAAVTAAHSPKTCAGLRPEAISPADADIDSGMLERKTAASTATPTVPPPTRLIPIAADSGRPSSSAPSTSAAEDAPAAGPFGLLRRCPPRLSMSQSPAKKVSAPALSPSTTASAPARSYASPVSSNATALNSTPAPKPMVSPMTRFETGTQMPMAAPISSAAPPTKPHHAASSTRSAPGTLEHHDRAGDPGVVRQREVYVVRAQAVGGGEHGAGQHETRTTALLLDHLGVVPREPRRRAESLGDRLLGGEPRGQRGRRERLLGRGEQPLAEPGRAGDRLVEARDVDHVDADADDHGSITKVFIRP